MSKYYYPLSAPGGNIYAPGRFYTSMDYERAWIVWKGNPMSHTGIDYISMPFNDRRDMQRIYRWWLKRRKEKKNERHDI